VDCQKYSSEYRDKRVTCLRVAEALLLMVVPISMFILMIKDVSSVPEAAKIKEYNMQQSLQNLNIVMLSMNITLLILFLTSGVRLLATLKKYSKRVYQISRCKILFTLVIWTIGISLEIAKYTMEIVYVDGDKDLSFWHEYKLYNLKEDKPYYSMVMFACILVTEYLPLSTLLYSLLKSYRNNRERKCGPSSDQQDEYMLDEQEENEYECDGVARLSYDTAAHNLKRGPADMFSKQTEDSNSVYVQEIPGSHMERPVNKLDRSSICASKVSIKHQHYPPINNTTLAVPAAIKEYDSEEAKSE
jgi:hypothetical protein